MPVSTEHQGIVASELIGIDNGAVADGLDHPIQQALGRHISNPFDLDDAISLENSEDGDLSGRASPSFALASASEVGFIQRRSVMAFRTIG